MNTTANWRRSSWSTRELCEQTDATSTPVDAVLRLVSRLRLAGVPVSTDEAADALRALAGVDMLDRKTVRLIIRCALVKDASYGSAFARAFDEIFLQPRARTGRETPPSDRTDLGEGRAPEQSSVADSASSSAELLQAQLSRALADQDRAEAEKLAGEAVDRWAGVGSGAGTAAHHTARVLRTLDLDRILRRLLAPAGGDETQLERRLRASAAREQVDELRALLAQLVARQLDPAPAAPKRRLDDHLLLAATPDELAELRATLRPLARRIAARLHRARRRGRGNLDMRGTIRGSIATGGIPADPVLRRRVRHRPELVVLCDVSGSMAGFARFAVSLLHALQTEFPHTRTWAFVDGIVEITDTLAGSTGLLDLDGLLRHRGLVSGDGRSDYAAALGAFTRTWPNAVTCRSTVLVIGDARSHDREPATDELTEIARRARRVYWLNPEPRREWDTDDSHIALYGQRCAGVHEVATLRQLENCVASIAS